MDKPIELTLYSKADCPLCDEMKEAALEAARQLPIAVTYVDITADPALQEAYGLEIPLLFHNGTCVAKHRVTAAELAAKLRRRVS